MRRKRVSWTPNEDALLRKLFINENRPVGEVAAILKRTPSSVSNRLIKLDIVKGARRERWTEEEQKTLENSMAAGMTDDEIGMILNKCPSAVKSRRCYSSISRRETKRWTEEEALMLRDLAAKKTPLQKMADHFNTGRERVKSKLRSLGIYLRKPYHVWSEEEKDKMVALLDSGMSLDSISRAMNRPCEGIVSVCKNLGIATKYDSIRAMIRAKRHIVQNSFEKRAAFIVSNSRSRAARVGREFALMLNDIKRIYDAQHGLCFYTGLPMTFVINDDMVMSLDRIDSTRGYVSDNVVLSSWVANLMKSDLSVERFIAIAGLIWNKGTKFTVNPSDRPLPAL